MEKPNNSGIAKQLRNSETEAEKFLWTLLRAKKLNGVKFRRQAPIGVYVVDFVSFEKKLIIEIDGGQHSAEKNKEYDGIRTRWLESQGFRVIRFWNNDISQNIDGVITRITEVLDVHPLPSALSHQGRGN
ncbi:MAG: endonuclease domain-containing protein [Dehalococcoidales bacterium]|jgi:very-short-patch-repair endonuclease